MYKGILYINNIFIVYFYYKMMWLLYLDNGKKYIKWMLTRDIGNKIWWNLILDKSIIFKNLYVGYCYFLRL